MELAAQFGLVGPTDMMSHPCSALQALFLAGQTACHSPAARCRRLRLLHRQRATSSGPTDMLPQSRRRLSWQHRQSASILQSRTALILRAPRCMPQTCSACRRLSCSTDRVPQRCSAIQQPAFGLQLSCHRCTAQCRHTGQLVWTSSRAPNGCYNLQQPAVSDSLCHMHGKHDLSGIILQACGLPDPHTEQCASVRAGSETRWHAEDPYMATALT